ncbi:hypothetical protein DPMN_140927 [Dreissena polymorpha]|uniref:Uncharacterized protein n=1 Tax=Dreissena polymorpha TaxID=45954 RepID=A0A9D4GEF6_DREPO|nr:hypothetical protein DPMN_140927 [Dreissena polymorpha]
MTKPCARRAVLEGMPPLNASIDKGSLQNLCRNKLRLYLMNSFTNVVFAVSKLDCPMPLKDMLLLKDISWC